MKYEITHSTGYQYSTPASLSQNELFLYPRTTPSQEVLESRLDIEPKPQYLQQRTDFFGNTTHLFMVQHPHNSLEITATSVVETALPLYPPATTTMGWEQVRQRLKASQKPLDDLEACRFLFQSPFIQLGLPFKEYAAPSFAPETPILVGSLDLTRRIFSDFKYDKNVSNVDTTVDHVLRTRKGVCQDFAHLAISCLRSLGIAARYVSGYLETLPPPGKAKLIGADASHAWFSVFVPDFGWVDLDPTNNLMLNETYITVAWGRDYGDVAPVKGVVMGGGAHNLSVMVNVASL